MITSRMEMSLAACGCSMPGANRVCRLACPRSGFAKIRLPARSCRARKSGRTMRRGAPTGTCPSPRCAVAAGSHTRVQLASISPCYAWRRGVTARAGRRWGREWVCHRVVVGPRANRRDRRPWRCGSIRDWPLPAWPAAERTAGVMCWVIGGARGTPGGGMFGCSYDQRSALGTPHSYRSDVAKSCFD